MIDEEVDEFLEHFGIRGMHWGVRKKSDPKSNQKKNRNLKIKIVSAATIAVGTVFAVAFLAKKGQTRVHDYGYSNSTVDVGPMGMHDLRFGPDK